MLKKQFLNSNRIQIANTQHEWFYLDTLERYHEGKKTAQPAYGLGEVQYKFNNKGFRCDDFDTWENHKYRIMFAGCSDTEGHGMPLEETWAKLFHGKVCEKLGESIPFWNIAHGAASTDHIVKHLYNEGSKLRPQVVIALLPHFERRERWDGDHWGPWNINTREEKHIASVFLKDNYIRYQTEKNLAFINLLMNKWDSIFLYSKNDKNYDLSNINFPRFTEVNHYLEYIDYSRDCWHGGPETHRIFADKMFETLWPKIQEKLSVS